MSAETDQLKQGFADQFEPSGDGQFLYRKNQKEAPIPVTREERDRFVADYSRRIRYSYWGMIAATILFFGGMVMWMIRNASMSMIPLYAGLGALLVAFVSLTLWIRGAPARELQRRSPVGTERSREEMRAIFLNKLSYRQLAGSAAIGVFIGAFRSSRGDTGSTEQMIWFALGAGLVLLCGIQAFRKWRFENDHPNDIIS